MNYRYFNGRAHGVELCMVMDGHDGEKAADFSRLHIPGKLLANRIIGGPDEVCQKIHQAFRDTEMQFFMALDDALTRKLSLQSEINVSVMVKNNRVDYNDIYLLFSLSLLSISFLSLSLPLSQELVILMKLSECIQIK